MVIVSRSKSVDRTGSNAELQKINVAVNTSLLFFWSCDQRFSFANLNTICEAPEAP